LHLELLQLLLEEKRMKLRGGLYHQTQVKLCYNSNRIEGSRLSEEQTRHIFETNTLDVPPEETADVDDIVETANHFACFDFMLEHAAEPLTEDLMKELHRMLKSSTSDDRALELAQALPAPTREMIESCALATGIPIDIDTLCAFVLSGSEQVQAQIETLFCDISG